MKSILRCVYCNRVSDQSAETNAEEVIKGDFYRDKKHGDIVICHECQDHHDQIMADFRLQDELKFNRSVK